MDLPRDENRQETKEGSQQDQGHTQAVHPQVIVGVQRGNPQVILLKLNHSRRAQRTVKGNEEVYRQD